MTELKEKEKFNLNTEEMAQAGLHLGHKTSKIHPKMEPYLSGSRNSIHIINLEETAKKLREALNFIQNLILNGKIILLVGTKIQIKNLVKGVAIDCGLPYVNERWLGGTFTNFDVIKKRIENFKDLEKKKADGELDKYTKKERAKFDKQLQDFEIKFGGLKSLERLPDTVLVLDMKKDVLAVKEAKIKGITVVGISDTNIDPTLADYPIPANDDAITSVKYILEKLKEVILKAKEEAETKKKETKKD
jgi:small subunit ribosomal protein S2